MVVDGLPAVTALQRIAAQTYFARVPAADRHAAAKLCAEALLERAGRSVAEHQDFLATIPMCTTWIASFLPPGGGAPLAEVHQALVQGTAFYLPDGDAPPQQLPAQLGAAANIVVQTEESRREETRWQTIHHFKLPRSPEGQYVCLYANYWLQQRGIAPHDILFSNWARAAQEFLTLSSVQPKLQDRYSRIIETIRCWFALLPPVEVAVEAVPAPWIKIFQAQIESFLELHLLHQYGMANFEGMTKSFWTTVNGWYHNTSGGFDYYKALTEAKAVKRERVEHAQDQKNGAGRGQRRQF